MSSKGGVTVDFRGYSVSGSINVGHHRDAKREAEEYREAEEDAKRAIRAAAPTLQRVYEHYADAEHAYRRHRTLLDRDRDQTLPSDRVPELRLPPAPGLGNSDAGFVFAPFFKPGTPPVLIDKVLADLLLSQFRTGPLASLTADLHVDPVLSLEDRIVNVPDSRSLLAVLEVARAREKELRRLVREAPAGPRYAALLLTSAMDRMAVPALAFDLLDELPPVGESSGPFSALLRFLPDAQWEAGIERIREDLGPLLGSNPRLQAWWAPVLGT